MKPFHFNYVLYFINMKLSEDLFVFAVYPL